MTLLTCSFDAISNGTAVSTGNSGGASGNAFDAVSIGASATLQADSTHVAHGAEACEVATGATSTTAYCEWNTSMGTQAQVWYRMYLYFTANPAASITLFRALNGATLCGAHRLNTSGKIELLNTSSTVIATTTNAIPLNALFRLEGFIIGNAATGQLEVKIFTVVDGPAPLETKTTSAAQNTNGSMANYRFGCTTNTANVAAFWQDELGLSSTGYVGAVPYPVTFVSQSGGTY